MSRSDPFMVFTDTNKDPRIESISENPNDSRIMYVKYRKLFLDEVEEPVHNIASAEDLYNMIRLCSQAQTRSKPPIQLDQIRRADKLRIKGIEKVRDKISIRVILPNETGERSVDPESLWERYPEEMIAFYEKVTTS